jgi:hypothetical protein
MRKSSAKVLDEGLSKAHRVFSDYIEPNRRVQADEAMDKLLGILDDTKFIEAWDDLKKETDDGRRLEEPRPAGQQPHQSH